MSQRSHSFLPHLLHVQFVKLLDHESPFAVVSCRHQDEVSKGQESDDPDDDELVGFDEREGRGFLSC